MSSLKLPLRVKADDFLEQNILSIVDARGYPVRVDRHRAEIIKAALEADAEKETKGG